MSRAHILVVDDEPDLLELVQYNLVQTGYDVTCVGSGEEALAAVGSSRPDLVVLDVLLSGMDGLDVCKKLKGDAQTSAIPIVMLTARGDEADVVTGLEVGADDYLSKPFSPRVLLARVKAALRRQHPEAASDGERMARGALVISPGEHDARVQGQSNPSHADRVPHSAATGQATGMGLHPISDRRLGTWRRRQRHRAFGRRTCCGLAPQVGTVPRDDRDNSRHRLLLQGDIARGAKI